MANDDDNNERLCFACESEKLGHNPSNWCPRCKWMIRPHCVGFVPVNAFSEEDINSVNEILENNLDEKQSSKFYFIKKSLFKFIIAIFCFFMGLNPLFGNLLYKGICPPSKLLIATPLLDF